MSPVIGGSRSRPDDSPLPPAGIAADFIFAGDEKRVFPKHTGHTEHGTPGRMAIMNEKSALVLTSDPFVREVVNEVLPSLGLRTHDERSADFPCLVIADSEYPDRSAVRSWLNRTELPPWIPVILVSGPRGGAEAAARKGASAVLSKPVDSRKMKAAINLIILARN